MLNERETARKGKNWKRSDELRDAVLGRWIHTGGYGGGPEGAKERMTRRAWAGGLLALLMIAGGALMAAHWQVQETVTYQQASMKAADKRGAGMRWPERRRERKHRGSGGAANAHWHQPVADARRCWMTGTKTARSIFPKISST